MKKDLFPFLLAICLVLIVAGCRKTDIPDCVQLISYEYYDAIGDVRTIDRFSYKNGLLDKVQTAYGTSFTMEYGANKKISGARAYDGATLLYDIDFLYANGRIAEEKWTDVATGQLYDHLYLSYNNKGQLIRNASPVFDFYVDYTYYPNGGLKTWLLVDLGAPSIKAEYTYKDNYKNPFVMIREAGHQFWYGNSGFGIGSGDRWYSSEKISFYNEQGIPETYYDEDPLKTVWTGVTGYAPKQADYADAMTGEKIQNIFEYEQCNARAKPISTVMNHFVLQAGTPKRSRVFTHINTRKISHIISPSKTW